MTAQARFWPARGCPSRSDAIHGNSLGAISGMGHTLAAAGETPARQSRKETEP